MRRAQAVALAAAAVKPLEDAADCKAAPVVKEE